jgi:hypothetical protein
LDEWKESSAVEAANPEKNRSEPNVTKLEEKTVENGGFFIRVARFFFLHDTKTSENIPNYHRITKWPLNMPNGRNIFEMSRTYTNISHSEALRMRNGQKIFQHFPF